MGLCICTQKYSNNVLNDSSEKQEHYSKDIHKLNKKSHYSVRSHATLQDSEECKTTFFSSDLDRASYKTASSMKDFRKSSRGSRISLSMKEVMMAETERSKVRKALRDHAVFSQFTEEIVNRVLAKMKPFRLPAKAPLYDNIQPEEVFYVLTSGKLEVLRENRAKDVIKPITVIYENETSAGIRGESKIRTTEKSSLWSIDREQLIEIIQTINNINYLEIRNFLDFHTRLCNLAQDKKLTLIGCSYTTHFEAGPILLESANQIYFILDGSVQFSPNPNMTRKLARGDFFGEHGIPSQESFGQLTAMCSITCLVIPYQNFSNTTGSLLNTLQHERTLLTVISNLPTLSILNKQQQISLARGFQASRFMPNSVVVAKNLGRNARMIVILKGRCMWENSKETVEPYSCLGISDVITDNYQGFNDNLVALHMVEIAVIDRNGFENAIGGSFARISLQNEAYRMMNAMTPFHYLYSSKLEMLVRKMRLRTYEDKEEIIKEGDTNLTFYILQSGHIHISSVDNQSMNLQKGDTYGKMCLFQDEVSKFTLIANGQVSCWTLQKEDFCSVVDSSRRKQLLEQLDYLSMEVSLEDLVIVKPLAKGMSGLVFLTVHKSKNLLYALKTYNRKMIEAYHMYESIQNEKNILMQLDHPMILKLVKTFKDEHRIYFLSEYIKGQDLFDVLPQLSIL
jgi:cGMP-dependent protein kinase